MAAVVWWVAVPVLCRGFAGVVLGAGVCWALYILFGRRAGAAHGGQITALGTVIGALMIVPIGYAHSGATLLAWAILPLAVGVAVLSSALPYSLEMYAMPRIPTRTFGVLMSLNPALGAVAGVCSLTTRGRSGDRRLASCTSRNSKPRSR